MYFKMHTKSEPLARMYDFCEIVCQVANDSLYVIYVSHVAHITQRTMIVGQRFPIQVHHLVQYIKNIVQYLWILCNTV